MKTYREEHERVLGANLKDVVEKQKEKGSAGAARRGYGGQVASSGGTGDKDSMDVDEPADSPKGKNRKCVGVPLLRLFDVY